MIFWELFQNCFMQPPDQKISEHYDNYCYISMQEEKRQGQYFVEPEPEPRPDPKGAARSYIFFCWSRSKDHNLYFYYGFFRYIKWRLKSRIRNCINFISLLSRSSINIIRFPQHWSELVFTDTISQDSLKKISHSYTMLPIKAFGHILQYFRYFSIFCNLFTTGFLIVYNW
jgi:hypothetical protein